MVCYQMFAIEAVKYAHDSSLFFRTNTPLKHRRKADRLLIDLDYSIRNTASLLRSNNRSWSAFARVNSIFMIEVRMVIKRR